MAHVFVSYVHENEETVTGLCEALEAAGVKVWRDRDSILPGANWQGSTRQAIREGAFFIACFSMAYRSKPASYMNEELALAIEMLRQPRPSGRHRACTGPPTHSGSYARKSGWSIASLLASCLVVAPFMVGSFAASTTYMRYPGAGSKGNRGNVGRYFEP